MHLEIEYKTCTKDQELFFQSEVVKVLPGYKITGLEVVESETFKPHQIFMDIDYSKPEGRL